MSLGCSMLRYLCFYAVPVLNLEAILTFSDDILRVLIEAGEKGLRLQKIVLHVYNCHNSLFESVPLEEVRKGVVSYLRHHCRHSDDLIEKTNRGVYKINVRSSFWRQLRIQFDTQTDGQNDETVKRMSEDKGPTLFSL